MGELDDALARLDQQASDATRWKQALDRWRLESWDLHPVRELPAEYVDLVSDFLDHLPGHAWKPGWQLPSSYGPLLYPNQVLDQLDRRARRAHRGRRDPDTNIAADGETVFWVLLPLGQYSRSREFGYLLADLPDQYAYGSAGNIGAFLDRRVMTDSMAGFLRAHR